MRAPRRLRRDMISEAAITPAPHEELSLLVGAPGSRGCLDGPEVASRKTTTLGGTRAAPSGSNYPASSARTRAPDAPSSVNRVTSPTTPEPGAPCSTKSDLEGQPRLEPPCGHIERPDAALRRAFVPIRHRPRSPIHGQPLKRRLRQLGEGDREETVDPLMQRDTDVARRLWCGRSVASSHCLGGGVTECVRRNSRLRWSDHGRPLALCLGRTGERKRRRRFGRSVGACFDRCPQTAMPPTRSPLPSWLLDR